jgi:hypothetical protein
MMLDPLGLSRAARPRRGGAGTRHRRRGLVVMIAAAALLPALVGSGRAGAAGILRLRCTNAASGTSWPIAVDLEHGRVDSQAASITDKWISWHDPKEGFFDLDRTTGKLQFRNASSTGGYFLYYSCQPERGTGAGAAPEAR